MLIEATEDQLIITATDLMVGIRCSTEAKILEQGATTLPARKLAQLIRELTAINVEVSTNGEITEIIADASKFKLHGMSKNEFPSLPDLTGALHFVVKQADLKDMLYRTAFAVSKEDNRYVLTGVCMQIVNGYASFSGTDGKRLAHASLRVDVDSSFTGSFIIPLKAVEEIFKSLLEDDSTAQIYLLNDKIAVDLSNTIIVTKLLTGDYPDIKRVIPEKTDIVVALHREELMTLLRQVSLFTNEDNHSVRFTLSNGELKLSANTMEVGEGRVSMPANYHGPKMDIAFNPTFFLDILRHSKKETVTMGIIDAYNPGLIADEEMVTACVAEANPLFVLMPMRLSEE
jgi:DNA polymerase-3 subunit beta